MSSPIADAAVPAGKTELTAGRRSARVDSSSLTAEPRPVSVTEHEYTAGQNMFTDGDVLIVGGGPAGLTAAISLIRRAPRLRARVVVLEGATYPREKYCAGAVGGRGDRILRTLDASPDVPCAPIDGISLRVEGGEVAARIGGIGRVVRRIEFDHALAKIARAAGVHIVEGTRVTDVTTRPKGARVETTHGAIDAAIVIGADGVGSTVRKAIGLTRGAWRAQVLEVDTPPVASDRERAFVHFDASDRRYPGYSWDFPTVFHGEEMVCRGVYHLRMGDEVVDIQALLAERLAAVGLDLAKCKNKRYAERGFELDGELARGPVLLIGEAAGIDPITGEGIAQAIEYGDLVARFLGDHFDRATPLHTWTERLRSSRLGRDLAVRTHAIPAFYAAARPRVERFLCRNEHALHLGCQHFGGVPIDRTRLAKFAVRGAVELAAEGLSRAFGPRP
jgi:flavin-dependent dehydrogenase